MLHDSEITKQNEEWNAKKYFNVTVDFNEHNLARCHATGLCAGANICIAVHGAVQSLDEVVLLFEVQHHSLSFLIPFHKQLYL